MHARRAPARDQALLTPWIAGGGDERLTTADQWHPHCWPCRKADATIVQ